MNPVQEYDDDRERLVHALSTLDDELEPNTQTHIQVIALANQLENVREHRITETVCNQCISYALKIEKLIENKQSLWVRETDELRDIINNIQADVNKWLNISQEESEEEEIEE